MARTIKYWEKMMRCLLFVITFFITNVAYGTKYLVEVYEAPQKVAVIGDSMSLYLAPHMVGTRLDPSALGRGGATIDMIYAWQVVDQIIIDNNPPINYDTAIVFAGTAAIHQGQSQETIFYWLEKVHNDLIAAGITPYHVYLPPVFNINRIHEQPEFDAFNAEMVARNWNVVGQSIVYDEFRDYRDGVHLNDSGNLLLLTTILMEIP